MPIPDLKFIILSFSQSFDIWLLIEATECWDWSDIYHPQGLFYSGFQGLILSMVQIQGMMQNIYNILKYSIFVPGECPGPCPVLEVNTKSWTKLSCDWEVAVKITKLFSFQTSLGIYYNFVFKLQTLLWEYKFLPDKNLLVNKVFLCIMLTFISMKSATSPTLKWWMSRYSRLKT